MKLLLFASFPEAEATIDCLHAKKVDSSTFHFDGGVLAISGIGLLWAQHTLLLQIPKVKEVWNLGLAGSLRTDLPLGSIHPITCVDKWINSPPSLDFLSEKLSKQAYPSIDLESKGLKLITSDFPLHDQKIRETLSEKWDLIDMEGYSVAFSCKKLSLPCYLYKIVSDFSSEEGRLLIKKHMKEYSKALSEKIKVDLCQLAR